MKPCCNCANVYFLLLFQVSKKRNLCLLALFSCYYNVVILRQHYTAEDSFMFAALLFSRNFFTARSLPLDCLNSGKQFFDQPAKLCRKRSMVTMLLSNPVENKFLIVNERHIISLPSSSGAGKDMTKPTLHLDRCSETRES